MWSSGTAALTVDTCSPFLGIWSCPDVQAALSKGASGGRSPSTTFSSILLVQLKRAGSFALWPVCCLHVVIYWDPAAGFRGEGASPFSCEAETQRQRGLTWLARWFQGQPQVSLWRRCCACHTVGWCVVPRHRNGCICLPWVTGAAS